MPENKNKQTYLERSIFIIRGAPPVKPPRRQVLFDGTQCNIIDTLEIAFKKKNEISKHDKEYEYRLISAIETRTTYICFTFRVVTAIKPVTKADRNDFSVEPGNRTGASSRSIDDRQSDFLPTDAVKYADRLFPRSGHINGEDSPWRRRELFCGRSRLPYA